MHFSTGSKCICARALGFGSVGPCRGCLHGDLGSHEPLCHQLRECISAQILNAFGPAHSGLGAWGHVALFHGDLSTHTHKPLRHQPHECISASTLNAFAPCTRVWECGARFGHSQTASSPTSRMHFSTGSKCICAHALGFGSVGPCWTFTRRFGHAKNRFVTTRTNAIRHGF